eukprot:TRINITY_DN12294_c0_g7_i2.p1 TRINITY_DN12294_c0_g7~~TRINITY_DN12294_c0_g7_i2.p1  ORF type:complete len:572 (+),score=106.96 TRINITY_DN12294_c0_g7_i2:75-1790(+)
MKSPLNPQPLAPQTVASCVILYESFSNPLLTSHNRDLLFSFLISQISSSAIHKSLASLLSAMQAHRIPSDITELFRSRIVNVKSIDDLFVLFSAKLKEIRGETPRMSESRHLELGGILDTFVRKCQLEFAKMLFEELHTTFEVFTDFCKQKIPEDHPINQILDERSAAATLYKSPPTLSEDIKHPIGPAQHFLKYVNECLLYRPNCAIESLHNYFHAVSSSSKKPGPKMHYASLNLSSVHYRFGQFDEALLNIAETIKLAQSKNDKEAITYAMLWLSCILGELGMVELQKTLLQHILMESHEQKLNYIFILAAENFAVLEHTHRPILLDEHILSKFALSFGLPECSEPIWEKVLTIAMQKLDLLQSETSIHPPLDHFKPLGVILKAFNYSVHGIDCLFSSAERIQYSVHNQLRETSLNSYMLQMAVKKSEESMKDAFKSVRKTIGSNDSPEDWFSVLTLIHKFELTRNNISKCKNIEIFLFNLSLYFRKVSLLCSAWQLRNDRLIHQDFLHEALISIQKLIKFSSTHGLLYRAFHDYLSIVQIYIVTALLTVELQRILAGHDLYTEVYGAG